MRKAYESAKGIVFLASDNATFIAGSALVVDEGPRPSDRLTQRVTEQTGTPG
jgi:hypothetical protein